MTTGNEVLTARYGNAMAVQTQGDADAMFAELCDASAKRLRHVPGPRHILDRDGNVDDEPDHRTYVEEAERQNLATYAAFFGAETRERVERLFRCEHPKLGAFAEHGHPSAEQAAELGAQIEAPCQTEGCEGFHEPYSASPHCVACRLAHEQRMAEKSAAPKPRASKPRRARTSSAGKKKKSSRKKGEE